MDELDNTKPHRPRQSRLKTPFQEAVSAAIERHKPRDEEEDGAEDAAANRKRLKREPDDKNKDDRNKGEAMSMKDEIERDQSMPKPPAGISQGFIDRLNEPFTLVSSPKSKPKKTEP